jgi:hypothetical protein
MILYFSLNLWILYDFESIFKIALLLEKVFKTQRKQRIEKNTENFGSRENYHSIQTNE